MPNTQWRVNITISSSGKQRAEEIARGLYRTPTNYVRWLIEKDAREREAREMDKKEPQR